MYAENGKLILIKEGLQECGTRTIDPCQNLFT